MKIVHICLAARYVEGFGYQENIIPQIHKNMGNEVLILTSEYEIDQYYKTKKRKNSDYVNDFGIRVKSLKKSDSGFFSRFGIYADLNEALEDFSPNIIFVHGGQFFSLKDVVKYCKGHKGVKMYIDQHADYYNSPVDAWKRKMCQRYIYGTWMRKAIRYTSKFWGVTPWRCDYLHDVYKIPKDKIDLLVMGGDDRYIRFDKQNEIWENVRNKLNISESDFVIISGGKINKDKNIHLLMQAVLDLHIENLKLIVFGQPLEDIKEEFYKLLKNESIIYINWIKSEDVYDYFLASDLAVFPGTHSVLWEQAVACGIPTVFKDWQGMHHVDVGGNCVFLKEDSVDEIKKTISEIYENREMYDNMKKTATEKGIKEFSYSNIARKAIELS